MLRRVAWLVFYTRYWLPMFIEAAEPISVSAPGYSMDTSVKNAPLS